MYIIHNNFNIILIPWFVGRKKHIYVIVPTSSAADSCSGESNSGLCRRVLQAEKHNKRLEQKLKLRDGQINTFRKQLEKITEIFREHHDSVDRAMLSMNSRLEHVEARNETVRSTF